MTHTCPFENRSPKEFSPYKTKQTLEGLTFETLYFVNSTHSHMDNMTKFWTRPN